MSRRRRKPDGVSHLVRTLATGVPYERERDMPLEIRPWLEFRRTLPHRDNVPVPDALEENETFWTNAHYLVHRKELRDRKTGEVGCVHLSMRTVENDTRHDWREMQRVKNELCGPEWEAVEMYPAESRVIDTANQYHLFCFPPGSVFHEGIGSVGFNEGRHVYSEDDDEERNKWLAEHGREPVTGHKQRLVT